MAKFRIEVVRPKTRCTCGAQESLGCWSCSCGRPRAPEGWEKPTATGPSGEHAESEVAACWKCKCDAWHPVGEACQKCGFTFNENPDWYIEPAAIKAA